MSRAITRRSGRVTREAVNAGDDDNIAVREVTHELLKLRSVGGGAGDLLAEHLFASRRLELGKLAGEVLGNRRDAGIAGNHARIVQKAEFDQLLGFDKKAGVAGRAVKKRRVRDFWKIARPHCLLVRTLSEWAISEVVVQVFRNPRLVKITEKTMVCGTFTSLINETSKEHINQIIGNKLLR
jgi:hypothetical protein